MLQTIRDRLSGLLAFIILIILVIPFAFVGINNYFVSNPENNVARINDEVISIAEYQSSFQQFLARQRARFGANFDVTFFDQPIMRRQHLDALINTEILQQVGQKNGLAVSEEELQSLIANTAAFQLDGRFNQEVYLNLLTNQGLSPASYQRQLAQDVVNSQLPEAVLSSAIATQHEIETYARLQNQTRDFSALVIPSAKFTDGVEVDDADIQSYYEDHAGQYMSEEQVSIEYIELSVQNFTAGIEPTEDILRARYEEQKARFVNPERRLASHILLNLASDADEAAVETARQRAEELSKQARAGQDFAQLASEHSDDPGSAANGGDLGWVEPGVMVKSFEDALYALGKNDISDPVRSGFGFHVIQLRDIEPSEGMSFEEAWPQLEQEFQEEEADRLYLEQADRLVDLIYEDQGSLAPASDTLGLEIKTAGPFGRGGGEGIAADRGVIDAAFSDLVLLEGANSEPVDLGSNHLLVLRVSEHLPSAQQALEAVSDQIREELRLKAATEAAKAEAEGVAAALAGGEDLAALAGPLELAVTEAQGATRRDFQHGQELLEQIFKLPVNAVETARVVPVGEDYAVVTMQTVKDGELDAASIQNAQFQRIVANASGTVENSGLLDQLRAQADIEIFENNIARQ